MKSREEGARQIRTLESSEAYLERVRTFMTLAESERLPQRARQAVAAAERFLHLATLARRLEQRRARSPAANEATESTPAGFETHDDRSVRAI